MATFQFNGTVIQDLSLIFSQVGNGHIREGETMIFTDFGMAFTQSEPPTLVFGVTETSDHISDVGLRYGSSGAFTANLTLDTTEASDLAQLQMQVTAADVTSNEPFTITITTTDP